MLGPFGIVLHHTGGRFESDLATLTKEGTEVSANDFIDKQGRIFELCELPKRAWHAGEADLHGITDWNTHGWGIEIENLGTVSDSYPRRQIEAVVWRRRRTSSPRSAAWRGRTRGRPGSAFGRRSSRSPRTSRTSSERCSIETRPESE